MKSSNKETDTFITAKQDGNNILCHIRACVNQEQAYFWLGYLFENKILRIGVQHTNDARWLHSHLVFVIKRTEKDTIFKQVLLPSWFMETIPETEQEQGADGVEDDRRAADNADDTNFAILSLILIRILGQQATLGTIAISTSPSNYA